MELSAYLTGLATAYEALGKEGEAAELYQGGWEAWASAWLG